MNKIAIFASGTGTNAQKLIDHFRLHKTVRVALIVSNQPKAGVLSIAAAENIPVLLIDKERFFRGDGYVPELQSRGIDFLVLAGFLWKIPVSLLKAYPQRILNIHPALLPSYGGKGMYGAFVHQAVLDHGEKETGITIHLVDEIYDHGRIIFQATCPVLPGDSATSLAKRVAVLEHEHYPAQVERLLSGSASL